MPVKVQKIGLRLYFCDGNCKKALGKTSRPEIFSALAGDDSKTVRKRFIPDHCIDDKFRPEKKMMDVWCREECERCGSMVLEEKQDMQNAQGPGFEW